MMIKSMSLTTRRELLASIREKYRDASWVDRGRLIGWICCRHRLRAEICHSAVKLCRDACPAKKSAQHPRSMMNKYDRP